MSRPVVITDRAHGQMEAIYQWWSENRSQEQAARWYNSFTSAIESLAQNYEQYAASRENGRFAFEIRDINFGVGRRRTHRAVFTIRRDMVLVLAIRHLGQQDLAPDDLT